MKKLKSFKKMWRLTMFIFQNSRHSTLQVAFYLRLHPEPSDGLTAFTLLSESSEKCGKGWIRTSININLFAYSSRYLRRVNILTCVYQFRHFAKSCPSFRAVNSFPLISVFGRVSPRLSQRILCAHF